MHRNESLLQNNISHLKKVTHQTRKCIQINEQTTPPTPRKYLTGFSRLFHTYDNHSAYIILKHGNKSAIETRFLQTKPQVCVGFEEPLKPLRIFQPSTLFHPVLAVFSIVAILPFHMRSMEILLYLSAYCVMSLPKK